MRDEGFAQLAAAMGLSQLWYASHIPMMERILGADADVSEVMKSARGVDKQGARSSFLDSALHVAGQVPGADARHPYELVLVAAMFVLSRVEIGFAYLLADEISKHEARKMGMAAEYAAHINALPGGPKAYVIGEGPTLAVQEGLEALEPSRQTIIVPTGTTTRGSGDRREDAAGVTTTGKPRRDD